MKFKDKIVLVTGASSGIGQATARCFIEQGATVFGFGRNMAGLEAVEGLLPCAGDITDHAELGNYVKYIIDKHGGIDVLVNNAGFSYYKRHAESTLEEWRRTMSVNLEGYYIMAKLVAPSMMEKGMAGLSMYRLSRRSQVTRLWALTPQARGVSARGPAR